MQGTLIRQNLPYMWKLFASFLSVSGTFHLRVFAPAIPFGTLFLEICTACFCTYFRFFSNVTWSGQHFVTTSSEIVWILFHYSRSPQSLVLFFIVFITTWHQTCLCIIYKYYSTPWMQFSVYSWLNPKLQWLAYIRCSINICWITNFMLIGKQGTS